MLTQNTSDERRHSLHNGDEAATPIVGRRVLRMCVTLAGRRRRAEVDSSKFDCDTGVPLRPPFASMARVPLLAKVAKPAVTWDGLTESTGLR